MKLIGAMCVVVACSVALGAQSAGPQSETKIYKNQTDTNKTEVKKTVEVKDGTEIKAIGCVVAGPLGNGYVLTNVGTKHAQYTLVTDIDMSGYLDHRMQVTGTATDQGDGAVKLVTTTTLDNRAKAGITGQSETKTTTEAKGAIGTRFLTVKSVRKMASTCGK